VLALHRAFHLRLEKLEGRLVAQEPVCHNASRRCAFG